MKKNTGKHNNKFAGWRWLILVCVLGGALLGGSAMAETLAAAENSLQAAEPAATATAILAAAPDIAGAAAGANLPASAASAYKPALSATGKSSTTSQLANLIGGLALILALIYGLSWFVKRFAQGGFMQNSSIKMLSSMPLGTRERLMLVEVGGKQILLGVTAAQINSLHVFDEPVVQSPDTKVDKSGVPATSDFSEKLMAILQQKNSGKTDSSAHKNIK